MISVNLKKRIKNIILKSLPFYRKEVDKNNFLEDEILTMANILDGIDKKYLQEIEKEHVKRHYRLSFGGELDLDNPKTFNEKLQWLKVYQREPIMTIMSDKLRVREYITEKKCEKYLNELYGVYANSEELLSDLDKLPEKFVVKVNHNSGGVYIVDNKMKLDIKRLSELDEMLKKNYYTTTYGKEDPLSSNGENLFYRGCEWNYKDIEPRLIVEKYLEEDSGNLHDYKFFCMNGEAQYIQVQSKSCQCFYDRSWVNQTFFYDTENFKMFASEIKRPNCLDEMILLAEKLSEGWPFLRVDLYNLGEAVYLGELTFFPGSGTNEFCPRIWDDKLGELIDLK